MLQCYSCSTSDVMLPGMKVCSQALQDHRGGAGEKILEQAMIMLTKKNLHTGLVLIPKCSTPCELVWVKHLRLSHFISLCFASHHIPGSLGASWSHLRTRLLAAYQTEMQMAVSEGILSHSSRGVVLSLPDATRSSCCNRVHFVCLQCCHCLIVLEETASAKDPSSDTAGPLSFPKDYRLGTKGGVEENCR
jgi:hypothetical protein